MSNMCEKIKILVVEDERIIREQLASLLSANNYHVTIAENGCQAMTLVDSFKPNLIILDLGLPDIDGMTVLKGIRNRSNIPIIVVSARQEEDDKVKALDAGTNDYITKPFGKSELLARIRATLWQNSIQANSPAAPNIIRSGGLVVNITQMKVFLDEEEVFLTRIEYKILLLLARNAGKVLTHDYIIQEIWGPGAADVQTLRVNMGNIRRKIEVSPADPVYLITEVGVGYRLASNAWFRSE